ncbi:bifunctional adenosylcobinamide kinase/adenosylcobinamide-phosphate guanylyltransferase [Cytobacillus purgationiresistens]|uniref:Adenosyl cobinamide kinase/adenosyl cobinamide phosphate guanylyltransferase n=1 Tax=Cytobacillus purgationiresistens TaxID=863449 RepID=A0ABU0APM0_9BACI|nr:bifunctional adenosylcobinamide kinase/adenosylcobinamide-phosphate guanylyltransferase [Cytobacillus purgationiresistens]MDQ0273234.1 adenosyl cobinamide kinase/adenosyl cobinamide phosphate guanylyltransferase [Cytobacillus purgationiresistens]
MHFITGGAFNGKSKWVCKQYGITKSNGIWISAYRGSAIPNSLERTHENGVIVFEGIEYWVKDWLEYGEKDALQRWQNILQDWQLWEKSHPLRKVILIGTDITKGIVPISAEERTWRDVTGRVFQATAKTSSQMDLIWYGISQKIK